MSSPAPPRQRLLSWLADKPDDTVLRWIFRCVITAAVAVLSADLIAMNGWTLDPGQADAPAEVRQDTLLERIPGLMPTILAPLLPGGDKRLIPLRQPDGRLAQPMTFELVGSGKLLATGTITQGTAQAFASEVERRGDYIKTVVLNSPGGSVADALAMGRLIRARKFATEVEAGTYCASSCPLVFAGGVERRAGDRAVIGVHQIAAVKSQAVNGPPRDEMSIAQNISARCERYLADMGVDMKVWIHAMETPHDRLFVFKPDEMKSLELVTTVAPATAKTRL